MRVRYTRIGFTQGVKGGSVCIHIGAYIKKNRTVMLTVEVEDEHRSM